MPILPAPPLEVARGDREERDVIQTADFGELPPPPDQDYFLRLLDRILPPSYVEGLKNGGGYELLHATAAVGARAALASWRWDRGTLVGYASPGARATGWVYFYRDSFAAGAGVMKAGTVVGTRDRRTFRTTRDVAFGATDLGPIAAPVEATLMGAEFNVGGEELTAYGERVPGQITEIYVLRQDPDFFDASVRVRNAGPTEGGEEPQLEQLARDRSVPPRLLGETVEAFRLRIKAIGQGVTPAGLEQSVNHVLRSYSPLFTAVVADQWDYQVQTGYDCLIPAPARFPSTVFVYDDPRPPGIQNRMLSPEGADGGGFTLYLPVLPCLQDQRFFLNDPAADVEAHRTPLTDGGRRGYSYLSLPEVLPDDLLPTAIGGWDLAAQGAYASAIHLADAVRAVGTRMDPLLAGYD